MKTYLHTIQQFQKIFLMVSVAMMLALPILLAFYPESISDTTMTHLYDLSHIAVFFVMIIRPLADIFFTSKYIRPLVILRKGVGVLSASLVMSIIFSKIIVDPSGYFGSFGTTSYWSLYNLSLIHI